MPRALKDILAEMRELITGDYTMVSLLDDLQKQDNGWPELHQQIFNAGHKKATAAGGQDIRTLEKKLSDEQDVSEGLRKQIKRLEEKAPDAAALRQEYETREANLRRDYEGRIGQLEGQVTTGYRMTRAQKLAKELSNDENRLEPEYAMDLAETKYADRFTEDEKKQPIVLQLGQSIPYAALTEDEAIKLLAKDIMKGIPSWAPRRQTVDRGAGNRGDGPGGQNIPPRSQPDSKAAKAATGDYAF